MPDPRIFPIENANDVSAGVTDASVVVLIANEERADLEIINDGEADIWLGRGNVAVVGQGIFLVHMGGSYSVETPNLFLGYFAAICDIGEDGHLTISEGEWR